MKNALLVVSTLPKGNSDGYINIGDYIQSLAGKVFFDKIDVYINRERLSQFKSEREKVKMIMNGWFMHSPENWPPSDDIFPLLVAIHISPKSAPKMLSVEGINYLTGLNLRKNNKQQKSKKPAVLDLCCGTGRIAIELARRGCVVTGIDICENYLQKIRKAAVRESLNIECIGQDVRNFKQKNIYDLALILYNSFGYFENPKNDFLFLKNAYNSLKKDGYLIIDVLGKEIAVRNYTEAEWIENDNYTFLSESYPIDSWGSIKNRWILLKGKNRLEKIFTQRLYAASELKLLLFKAGFSSVEIYGDWDKSPYGENAKTLIAAGKKS